jgi:hypothetical protein
LLSVARLSAITKRHFCAVVKEREVMTDHRQGSQAFCARMADPLSHSPAALLEELSQQAQNVESNLSTRLNLTSFPPLPLRDPATNQVRRLCLELIPIFKRHHV